MAKKKVTKKAEPVVEPKEALEPVEKPKAEVATVAKKAGWIKATVKEVLKYQAEGRLYGHNPRTGEALVK